MMKGIEKIKNKMRRINKMSRPKIKVTVKIEFKTIKV